MQHEISFISFKPEEELSLEQQYQRASGYRRAPAAEKVVRLLLSTSTSYCGVLWKDNHRKDDNFEKLNVLVLDFDDPYPTEDDVLEAFDPYRFLLGYTKSHGIEKHGVVCDRFRVVLLLDAWITDLQDYKDVLALFAEEFGADTNVCHAGMAFAGNPLIESASDCYGSFSPEKALFPISTILGLIRQRREKQLVFKGRQYQPRSSFKNEGPYVGEEKRMADFRLVDGRKQEHSSAKLFIDGLHEEKRVPILCPFPGHADGSPSAFVVKNKHGLRQVTCVVCKETKFIYP